MTIEVSMGGGQIVGNRELQEDAFLIKSPLESAGGDTATLLIVADGIGGQYGGNIASRLAVKSFSDAVASQFARTGDHLASNTNGLDPSANVRQMPSGASQKRSSSISQILCAALERANNTLAAAKARKAQLAPMGSTFVAALIVDDKLWWISVGDSHLYLVRKSKLERKNARHTYGAYLDEQARAGKSIEQASPRERKQLTSSLDGGAIPLIDCPKSPMQLEAGDVVVLASDGLDAVSDGRIVFSVTATDSAEGCAAELLNAVQAVAHPRQDNTTVVIYGHGSALSKPAISNNDTVFEKTITPND
jgi:PPM family protein phosphatase